MHTRLEHTYVENVAVLQRSLIGYTVADDFVDRGADALRITVVAERTGIAVALYRLVKDDHIYLICRHARSNLGRCCL